MHKTTATRSVLKAVLILILLDFLKRKKKRFYNNKSFGGTEDENDRVLGGILVDARRG